MPTYDYECLECRAHFSRIETMARRSTKVKCPDCGSRKTRQLFNTFYAKTVRKS